MRIIGACSILGAFLLTGCSTSEVIVAHSVDLMPSTSEIEESQLLDVGIVVFDAGVPEGEIDRELLEELIEQGTFVQIRRTEALYLAVELRETLQRSNQWGAVWITPEVTTAADVGVAAQIVQSDGEVVAVAVKATDAAGRVWIDDEYRVAIAGGAYNRERHGGLDPYQDLFNLIANDLVAARNRLAAEDLERVREIAALRYAAELSPEAFTDYVAQNKDGIYELNRLPAESDPQFVRTQRARQRERIFFETLDEHYANFAREAESSYDNWRQYSREETIQVREITRSARFRTGMGIASIVASFVYGNNSNNNSFSDRVIRDTLMYVGMDMLRTSATRRQEKQLHVEALEELSASFDDEVEPLVVEIQGTEHRLTGSAEVQYQGWKDLLRELYMNETGLAPAEMEVYLEETEETAPDVVSPEGEGGAPAVVPVNTDDEAAPETEAPAEPAAGDAPVEPTAAAPATVEDADVAGGLASGG